APEKVPIDGILIWENALRESCADDGDVLFAFHIELVEIASGYEGNAKGRKESGRNDTKACPRILFPIGANVSFRGELEADFKGITPGNLATKPDPVNTRKRFNATHYLFVESGHFLGGFTVSHSRNVYGEDVARVHTGLRPLQRHQRTDQHTCTSQQHER